MRRGPDGLDIPVIKKSGHRAFKLRRGGGADFPLLWEIEEDCFDPGRRSSEASIRHSLESPRQEVWLLEEAGEVAGALILRIFPQTLRIYSVAVRAARRGGGIGTKLVDQALRRAESLGCRRVVLEADERDPQLIAWYRALGFGGGARLPDYYEPGRAALRLVREIR